MCGIAGFVDRHPIDAAAERVLERMIEAIRARGPDDSGTWVDKGRRVALGHRRLAIVDTSMAGHQPMQSPGGRYVLVFNGEIYNHLQLRKELGADGMRGHSDTETLVHALEQWGFDRTVRAISGMFAFAVYDQKEKQLCLTVDRLGEKPLYCGYQGQSFLFGSDLAAIRCHPSFKNLVDTASVTQFLNFGHISAPHTIYRGISRLQPGTCLRVPLSGDMPVPDRYWFVPRPSGSERRGKPAAAWIDETAQVIGDSVERQMMGDVPRGALLSGGIDSSLIVAMMTERSSSKVQTFTVGSTVSDYDESGYAADIAAALGTEHTALRLSHREVLEVVPRIPGIYSEPFADSSQIPTLLVSQLAAKTVKFALTGDGGDELFAGYNRHQQLQALSTRFLRSMPLPLRRLVGGVVRQIPTHVTDRLVSLAGSVTDASFIENPGAKVHKWGQMVSSDDLSAVYRQLLAKWPDDSYLRPGLETRILSVPDLSGLALSELEQLLCLDLQHYLPNDTLVKLDRASMHVSLEARAPFLDRDVVEFAQTVPLALKIRQNTTKWILRQILYRRLPRVLIDRPKMGFAVPIGEWLRGPLRDWGAALLADAGDEYLQPARLREIWLLHQKRKVDAADFLWNVLMLEAWLRERAA